MKRMKRALLLVALLMLSTNGFAQTTSISSMMNFQGHLAKPDGTPVPDGNYQITFSIFAASSGGTVLWTQTMNPVMVHNGAFAVLLGNGPPSPPICSTERPTCKFRWEAPAPYRVSSSPPSPSPSKPTRFLMARLPLPKLLMAQFLL